MAIPPPLQIVGLQPAQNVLDEGREAEYQPSLSTESRVTNLVQYIVRSARGVACSHREERSRASDGRNIGNIRGNSVANARRKKMNRKRDYSGVLHTNPSDT